MSMRTRCSGWAPLALVLLVAGCNNHPLETLDDVLTAANRKKVELPARSQLDFLFVIDNSGSMCEEQKNLGRNFGLIAEFLFEELGNSADYRIAVTSTDMLDPERAGHFLNTPARPIPAQNCLDPDTGEADIPDTADCPNDLPLIIKSGETGNIADLDDLLLKFKCMATLGTDGDSFEKGLESMRRAISCDGPNVALFSDCCVEGEYDPFCQIPPDAPGPEFMRPNAVLVVVFLSDENDCSDPVSNPGRSQRAICKYGAVDGDHDGIPDGYRDAELCPDNMAACFQTECGGLTPDACHAQRCLISRQELNGCEWYRDDLTPVSDYFDFLVRLKSDPAQQIVVASIVGDRAYTNAGNEIMYNPPATPSDPECDINSDQFNPDKTLDECCPGGQCEGPPQPSCQSVNGTAVPGRRYLELAERFQNGGIATSICVDNFAEPLSELKRRIAQILGSYCLEKPPSCQVPPARDANGDVQPARRCETPEERAQALNYPVRVRMQCLNTIAEGGKCVRFVPPAYLSHDQWSLDLDAPTCAGGAQVRLEDPPPAGAEIFVEFLVDVSARAGGGGGSADGGAPPNGGPAQDAAARPPGSDAGP